MLRPLVLAGALVSTFAALEPAQAQFETELVAGGLEYPIFCLSPPGDTERLFVLEWKGKIRIVKNGVLLPDPFLDISDIVLWDNFERGLLGMAFDPNYDQNGWFYVYFINTATLNGSSAVRRFTVSADPDSANRSTLHRIFTLQQTGVDHKGGHIEFDDEGMLWLGLGDGANAPGLQIAQDPGSLFGKMIRIDPYRDDYPADATNNYGIPSDNPFVGVVGTLPEIWAIGLRNPYRFCFDPLNQDLYIGDVGQGFWEEIDWQPGTDGGGQNYGWPFKEGFHCYDPPVDCDPGGLTDPVHEYDHPTGFAVVGGRVYRGSAIPALQGQYFFGDYITDKVWTLRMVNGVATDVRDRTAEADPEGPPAFGNVAAFGEDASRELYIVDLGGGTNGQVYKIVPDPDASGAPVTVPAALTLSAPYPNPFSATTNLSAQLDRAASVEIGVYGVAGQLVRKLSPGGAAKTHEITWDGHDDRGAQVPAGVYFVRVKSRDAERTTRVTRLE